MIFLKFAVRIRNAFKRYITFRIVRDQYSITYRNIRECQHKIVYGRNVNI
jgi:hypothetical protein